ncbi:DNA-binding transcriptional MerR regulator [Arthrobacter sp. UYP6]|uniref:MerR family transcriptional regulator n=1 Tax=Arthrobacter sp. UYP6 TaxID=1756378 RepID=UPI00339B1D86
MRVSELAVETDISVATIKYYLRAGLLHEGRRTAPRQADYDAGHVSRLRLIRALLGPGGLSVAAAGKVLEQLDEPTESAHDLLGIAAHAAAALPKPSTSHPRADALLEKWGWSVDPEDHDARSRLEQALQGLEDAGFEPPEGFLEMYASAMREVAAREVEEVPQSSPAEALRYVMLGTVLVEPLLLALRRLAHQDASARIFARQASPWPNAERTPE